jgi:hypothetical protein
MKTLYLECNMGAAGDMLMAALLEVHPEPEGFMERLGKLGIPGVRIEKRTEKKCGITGTHVKVSVHGMEENEHIYRHGNQKHGENWYSHELSEEHQHSSERYEEYQHSHEQQESHQHNHQHAHHHSSIGDIEDIISKLNLPEQVHDNVMSVYSLIAEAESRAHNCEITDIHFHEVGTMDAVADIVGVCMLIDELGVDKIVVSPINVGKGQVKCAHGILPVPAPATAFLLKDVPIYSNDISGELCTPTGAALLKHFASEFAPMPAMRVEKIGYGMGTKDFEAANCVRAFLGETEDETALSSTMSVKKSRTILGKTENKTGKRIEGKTDQVAELVCNIDDMSGERIGFAMNRLLDGGALEVFTTPVGMKKNRPGILLTCLCAEDKKEEMIRLMFKHTTTIGIRENSVKRYVLDRTEETVHTKYGDVRVKKSSGYGVVRAKAEYDDMEKIAIENQIDMSEIEFYGEEIENDEIENDKIKSDKIKSGEIKSDEIENSNKINEKEQNKIYDDLERFYDADSYQEKLDILMPLRGKLTDVMITNIAISLDIVAQEGSLDDRFLSIVSCLETMKKYQSNRLR